MSSFRSTLTNVTVIIATWLFYFALVFGVILYGLSAQERSKNARVGKEIPERFPVLVVSQKQHDGAYQARIVYHYALADYMKRTSNCSFIVPKGHEIELNRRLKAQIRDIWQSDKELPFAGGWFEMQRLQNGRQKFMVDGSWDDDRLNRGWYTADANHIYPERYVKYFGPGICMMYFILAVPVVGTVFLIDQFIWRRIKRKARPQPSQRMKTTAFITSLICLVTLVSGFMLPDGTPSTIRNVFLGVIGVAAFTSKVLSYWVLGDDEKTEVA